MNTKNILFVCRKDPRIDYDTADSMAAGMQKLASNCRYEACDLEDLLFSYDGTELHVTNTVTGQDIREFDGIFQLGWFKSKLLEDLALSVGTYATAKGIPCLNTEAIHTRSRTKLSQYVIGALENIPMTPFVFSANPDELVNGIAAAGLPYPLIVKAIMASRGKDNYLVHTDVELSAVVHNQPDVPFIVQTFVPNDGDYRLIVMGDSVRFAMHRRATGDSHINNTSQGGQASSVDLQTVDQMMLADAVKIAKLLRREVTGVDMIIHKETGKYYLLEANNMPQLSTGSMVSEKLQALDSYLNELVS